jgi:tripartite-type tricarboxylate transporter receptor subunit TctC
MAGIDANHVPYKGATPALVDLIGGHIDFYFRRNLGSAPANPHTQDHGARRDEQPALVAAARRADRRRVRASGYDITTWFGLLAAAGTPREIVNKLNSVIVGIVNEPEMKSYLIGQGVDPVTNTPEQFAAYIKSEVPKFAKIVKAAGIKPE